MPRKVVIKQRVGIPRVCAWDGCKKPFTAYRADKVYHTDRCRAYACISRKVNPPEMLAIADQSATDFDVSDPFAALKDSKKQEATLANRVCAYAECGILFAPYNAKHRYHSDTCRYNAFVDRLKARKKPNEAKALLSELTPAQKRKMLAKLGIVADADVLSKLAEFPDDDADNPPEMLAEDSENSLASDDDSWFDTLKKPN